MDLDWQQYSPGKGATVITTIDAHAAGEPLRIVTGGLPPLPGATILERRRYLQKHLDRFRRLLMWEPHGHFDMYGAVLTPPVTPGADLGVLFMHNEGYSTMCGHGIIALVSTLLIDQSGLSGLSTIVVGCLTADVQTPVSTFFRSMYGGALVAAFGSILGWPTDLDVLLDASNGSEINLWGATGFGFQFGLTAVRGTLALTQNGIASFGGTARGASIIWGAGSSPLLYVAANYRLIYASGANKAVATFVGITLKINNQTSASAFNPTSGAFSAGTIALTAANLDTAFASSGFGGVAIVVGGGSITNQSD